MTVFEAFIYGLIQGVTEYLPVSSSAHLILTPYLIGVEDPGLAFDVFLHLGTLFSTLIYFWKDWKKLLITRDSEIPLSYIIYGTFPALIFGALFHKWISTSLRGTSVIIITLIIGGVLLYLVDILKDQKKTAKDITLKDALIIGTIQALALIPGMSRSGVTITGGRLLGLTRETAARFSFLLSAPVTLAATVFMLRKWEELIYGNVGMTALIVGCLSSFVFGMIAIGSLLVIVRKFSYLSFALYRVILAFIIFKQFGF